MKQRNTKLWINFPFLVLLFSQTVFVQITEGKNHLAESSDNSQESNKDITDDSKFSGEPKKTDAIVDIESPNPNSSDKPNQNVSEIKEGTTKIQKTDDNRILLNILNFLKSKDSNEIMNTYYSNPSNAEIKNKTLNAANQYLSEKGVSKDKFDDQDRFFSLLSFNKESGISKIRDEIADLESSNTDNSQNHTEITKPYNSILYRRSQNPISTRILLDLLNFLKSNNKIMSEYYSNLSNDQIKTKTLNTVNEYMSKKGVSGYVFADPDKFFPLLDITTESGIANVEAEISYLGSRDPYSMRLYSTVLEFLNSKDPNIQKTIDEYYKNLNIKTNDKKDDNLYMEKIMEAINAYFEKKGLQSTSWNEYAYYGKSLLDVGSASYNLKSLLGSSKESGIQNVKDTISYIESPNPTDTKLYRTFLKFLNSQDPNIQKTIDEYYKNLNAKTDDKKDNNLYMKKIIDDLNTYFDKKGLNSIRWNAAGYYLKSLLNSSKESGIQNVKDQISYIKSPNPTDTKLYSTVLEFLNSKDSNIQETVEEYYKNLNIKTNDNLYMKKIIDDLNAYFDKKGLQSITWNSADYNLKSLLGPSKASGIENVSYMSRNYDIIRLDIKVLKFLKSKDPDIKIKIDKYYKKTDDDQNTKELLDAFNAYHKSEGFSEITSDNNSRWQALLGTNKGLSILNIQSKIDYIKSKNPNDTKLYSNVLKFVRSEDSNTQKILKDYYDKPDDNINNLKKALNDYLKDKDSSYIQFNDNTKLQKLMGHNKGLSISNIQDEIFYANEGMNYNQKENLKYYGQILSFVDSKKDSDLKDYYNIIQSFNHDEVKKEKEVGKPKILKEAESNIIESFKKFAEDKYKDIYNPAYLTNIISFLGYNLDMAYKQIYEIILYNYEDIKKPDIKQISFNRSIHDFLTSDNTEYKNVINNYYLEKGNTQALKKISSYFNNKVQNYSSLDITIDDSYWHKLLGNDLTTAKEQAYKNWEKAIYDAHITKLSLEKRDELEKEEREQRPFKVINGLLSLFSALSPNKNKLDPLKIKWTTNINNSNTNKINTIGRMRVSLLRDVIAPLELVDQVHARYSQLTNWIRKKTPKNHYKPSNPKTPIK